MKILYIHQYFNTPEMSGGTRSYEMARRLVNKGHEVHIITTWRNPTAKNDWFESIVKGIHVHWLPVKYSNHMGYARRIQAFGKFALQAGRRAASIRGDLVFASSTPLTVAIPGVYASKKLGVPMVFEVRDLWPELPIAIGALRNPLLRRFAYLLERYAYRNSRRIVALSEGMRDGIVTAGYPPDQVEIIPNGCDIDFFQTPHFKTGERTFPPADDSARTVLYPGTLGVINGVSYLAQIAHETAQLGSNIRFVIVGDGKERESIEKCAKELGVLEKNLFMIPSVPKSYMPALFAQTDAVISLFVDLKPMWANSANKFFDALSAGKPVIINYSGWQAELLQRSGAGIQLPASNAPLAASRIVEWLNDERNLQCAGAAAHALAADRFDRDKLADKLEAVLEAALEASES